MKCWFEYKTNKLSFKGPINTDITTPTCYDMSDETMAEEIKSSNEVYEDINKIQNKVGN